MPKAAAVCPACEEIQPREKFKRHWCHARQARQGYAPLDLFNDSEPETDNASESETDHGWEDQATPGAVNEVEIEDLDEGFGQENWNEGDEEFRDEVFEFAGRRDWLSSLIIRRIL